jgi:TPR repeat protein
MQPMKKTLTSGLMILGLSFGLTLSAIASNESDRFNNIKASAERGDARDQYLTGFRYGEGIGVRQDRQKALYWLKKSSDQNFASAQFALGTMYHNGDGVRQNKSTAKEWFGKACDNGDQDGCDLYRRLNEQGN